MIVVNPRCEWRDAPLVDTASPRLTWELQSTVQGDKQTAYQVQAGTTAGGSDLWDSGKIATATPRAVYGGQTLVSRQRVYWRVRVWNAAGSASQWTAARFSMGLLATSNWGSAVWIGYQTGPVASSSPAAAVRKTFTPAAGKTVARAVLYATARGFYTPFLNGARVGQSELAPGWTKYSTRHQYQAHNVTAALTSGSNTLGFVVGDGWYHGNVFVAGSTIRNYYGSDVPRVLALLAIDYTDGTTDTIVTDATWSAMTTALGTNDLYNGTSIDGRSIRAGFTLPGDTSSTSAVSTAAFGAVTLTVQRHPEVKRQNEYAAENRVTLPDGSYLFDMGAVRAGFCRLAVSGAMNGQVITLKHSEDVYRNGASAGQPDYTNLRNAAQTDTVTCMGATSEKFEFPFTYHGFRYVQVSGYPGVPPLSAVTMVELYADRRDTLSFETSSSLLNTLYANARRSHDANALSLMTDCPARDERLAWNGDGSLSMTSFLYQRDNIAFLQAMLDRIQDDVDAQGRVSITAPDTNQSNTRGSAAGGEISAFLPAYLYLETADPAFLSGKYLSTLKLMLGYLPGPDSYDDYLSTDGSTDATLFSNAFGYRYARLVQQAATAAGDTTTANSASSVAATCLSAAQARIASDGTIPNGTQCGYVLALAFEVVPEAQRLAMGTRLANLVAANGIQVGLVGFNYLFDALTNGGQTAAAYSTLMTTSRPSIGYDALNGMTAISEYQDPIAREGQTYNSHCHQIRTEFLGWMVRTIAGINPDRTAPGYANVILRPLIGGGLTWARCTFRSVRGPISSAWLIVGAKMEWRVSIPAGSTATIVLPNGYTTAAQGSTTIASLTGVTALSADPSNGQPRWSLPSGDYKLTLS